MPNPTVGLGAEWPGCTVGRYGIRNFSSSTAHPNGGMLNFEMVVHCNDTDNSGTFDIPACYENVSLPYSCVAENVSGSVVGTTQDLTRAPIGPNCWVGAADKSLWNVTARFSTFEECKQNCARSFYQTLYNQGIHESMFDGLFPGYLG